MNTTRSPKSRARRQLGRLADALAEEALNAPDQEFLAELKSEQTPVDAMARAAKEAIAKGIAAHDKAKLAARLAAYQDATKQRQTFARGRTALTLDQKRQIVARFAAKDARLKARLTMAARGEEEMSERDLDGILEDLRDLGALDEEGTAT